jgi:hypothetical protein
MHPSSAGAADSCCIELKLRYRFAANDEEGSILITKATAGADEEVAAVEAEEVAEIEVEIGRRGEQWVNVAASVGSGLDIESKVRFSMMNVTE